MPDIFNILNKKSGVLGVSGLSNDMRDLEKGADEGNKRAHLALDMFADRVKKYIGAYMAEMNGCDAVIFTAGIGENGARIRSMVCADLEGLGIELDEELNKQAVRGKAGRISKAGSRVGRLRHPDQRGAAPRPRHRARRQERRENVVRSPEEP